MASPPARRAHPTAARDPVRRPHPSAQRQPGRPSKLLAAARTAAELGLYVFPLRPGSKTPAAERWEQLATRDPDQINRWWRRCSWNIGVATGPSDLLVIDLDVGHGGDPPPEWAGARDGSDVLIRLAQAHGAPIPRTL